MVCTLRKRRRQQYHQKQTLKRKWGHRRKTEKPFKTIDRGDYERPLKAPRRVVTIQDKLRVLDRYEEILADKQKALEECQAPRPLGSSRKQMKEWKAKRKAGKKRSRVSAQKICKQEFPDIVQGAQLVKWRKRAAVECWRDLPELERARCSATTNQWRAKLKLPLKGRSLGGMVPWCLQVELDTLMVELSSGASDVSERKELVTAEQIAP